MLTPEQIDELATRLVYGYQEAFVSALIERLVRALVSGGSLTAGDLGTLERLADMNAGAVSEVVSAYRARISKQVREQVALMLLDADAADVEVLSSLYGGALPPGASALFGRIARETAEGVALIIGRDNIAMASHAADVWYEVSAEAIARINHGAVGTDEALRSAVSRLLREGFTTIDYRSGVRSRIDVAVRRHIVSQVGQASGRMTMRRMELYGHDLVKTTAHFGARPEHAVWQGRVFSLSGSGGYPDFHAATGYGTVTGLQGANCRHSWGPWFPGMDETSGLPERGENGMTNDEYYEATQKQRAYERAIRDAKREVAALDVAGLDATEARLRLGAQQKRLKAYADKTGLPRLPSREKAYGIGRQPRALRKTGRR